ncbi:MAG: ABC transporter permease [Pirellulales bacterium]
MNERMTVPRSAAWTSIGALAWREWVRFVRQPNRVIGAVGQPVLFWLLFGAGFSSSFAVAGKVESANYREFFFPGTLTLILLFTAIFATISIIEDRREGFLQSVLVAPTPRWAMVFGKLLGGTLIAVAQATLFLMLGWAIGVPLTLAGVAATIATLFVVGLALTAMGFVIAWRLDSTQGFHAVMSVFLLPMWLLSGSFFPPSDNWLSWIVRVNPMTYATALIRRVAYLGADDEVMARAVPTEWHIPSLEVCIAVTLIFLTTMCVAAWLVAGRRTSGDLL